MIFDFRTHDEHGGPPEGGIVRIITYERFDAKGGVVLHGMPGLSFAGALAVGYLLKKMPKKRLGGIFSSLFSPMIQLTNSSILYPLTMFRLGGMNDNPLFAVFGEIPIPENALFPLMYALHDYYKQIGISRVIGIDGMMLGPRDLNLAPRTVVLTRSQSVLSRPLVESPGAHEGSEMVVAGVGGAILTAFDSIQTEVILAEAMPQTADLVAALAALERLRENIKIDVDLGELSEQAEDFRSSVDTAIRKGIEATKLEKRQDDTMWYS
jgi:predicted ATP-grasp superfamily ATP-dependent carboligase